VQAAPFFKIAFAPLPEADEHLSFPYFLAFFRLREPEAESFLF